MTLESYFSRGLETIFATPAPLTQRHFSTEEKKKTTHQTLHLYPPDLSIRPSISTLANPLQDDVAQFPASCAQRRQFVIEHFSLIIHMWSLIQNIIRSLCGMKKKQSGKE